MFHKSLKPSRADLFYPTMPTYKDEFEGETVDKEHQRTTQRAKSRLGKRVQAD